MSDQFLQVSTLGSGTTTASTTLAGVTAGSTLVAFFGNGSNFNPAVLSVADGQGSYTAQGSVVQDSGDNVCVRAFTLVNANAGSHTITGTTDSGGGCDIVVFEIGSTAGALAFSGANGAHQSAPGTGANALSSGSVTITAASTLACFALCSSSTVAGTEPTVGTGFTTRRNGATVNLGQYRVSTGPAAANQAATATAFTGTGPDEFITIGVAILNGSGAPSLGAIKQPGPGVSPSKLDQFKAAPRGLTAPLAVTTITQTVGAYTWAGVTGTLASPAGSGFIQGPGPGNKGPFNNGQFIAAPRGFTSQTPTVSATPGGWTWAGVTATTSQLVSATPGAWSWAGTTGTTSQLVNQSVGTWSWAGTTSATTQLINAAVGAYSWAGTTAGTTQLLNAAPGAWSWAGTTASLDNGLNATPGAWSWSGTTATTSQLLSASPGAWSWSGTTANLGASVDATPGRYSWAGVDAGIPTQITLIPGAWGWAGVDATIPSGVGEEYGKKKRKKRFKVGEQVFTDQAQALNALLDEPVAKPAKVAKAVDEHVELIEAVVKATFPDEPEIDWAVLDEEDIEMLLLSL